MRQKDLLLSLKKGISDLEAGFKHTGKWMNEKVMEKLAMPCPMPGTGTALS